MGAALSVTELDTIGADCGDRLQHTVFADVGDELHVEGVLFPTFVPIVRLAGIRSIGARATEPALVLPLRGLRAVGAQYCDIGQTTEPRPSRLWPLSGFGLETPH